MDMTSIDKYITTLANKVLRNPKSNAASCVYQPIAIEGVSIPSLTKAISSDVGLFIFLPSY
jgi:hypothetical protein